MYHCDLSRQVLSSLFSSKFFLCISKTLDFFLLSASVFSPAISALQQSFCKLYFLTGSLHELVIPLLSASHVFDSVYNTKLNESLGRISPAWLFIWLLSLDNYFLLNTASMAVVGKSLKVSMATAVRSKGVSRF